MTQTPNEIAHRLIQLANQLDDTVEKLKIAETNAVEKRHSADLSYGQAFLDAVGSVEQRKQVALVDTAAATKEADLAEVAVKHLRRRIEAIKVRIDVGRSYGAAVRAEINLAGIGVTP